jgi:predicted DNA-binding transcriptional regulator
VEQNYKAGQNPQRIVAPIEEEEIEEEIEEIEKRKDVRN